MLKEAPAPDAPETHIHARILWVSVVVIALSIVVHLFGRAINVSGDADPILLIALSPSIDHTLLVASQLSLLSFMIVNVLRRLIIDPFWFLLGWIGLDGLKESRLQFFREFADFAETKDDPPKKKFYEPDWLHNLRERVMSNEPRSHRSVVILLLLWHTVTADAVTSFLLGKRKVSPLVVLPFNLFGTVVTVYGLRAAGQAAVDYVNTIQLVSTIATIVIISGAAIRYRKSVIQYGGFTYEYARRWIEHLVVSFVLWRHF